LVGHFSATNPAFLQAREQLSFLLTHRAGVPAAVAPQAAVGVLNGLLDQQSGIMAYNDAASLVALVLIASLPLLLLLPRRPPPAYGTADAIAEAT
jgi:hypothetical protein